MRSGYELLRRATRVLLRSDEGRHQLHRGCCGIGQIRVVFNAVKQSLGIRGWHQVAHRPIAEG